MKFYNLIKKITILKYFGRLCKKNKFVNLIKRTLRLINLNGSERVIKRWQRADIFLTSGYNCKAEIIYKKLSKLKLNNSINYIYSALASQRLHDVSKAFTIFEMGIKTYPENAFLKRYYLQMCCSYDQLLRYSEFIKQVEGPKWDLETSLGDVCEEFIECNDPLKIWKLADIFHVNEQNHNAQIIYKKLSKIKLINPTNYIYAALAAFRLHDVSTAYAIFEEGIKAYPEDESLRRCYRQICACYFNHIHYSEFMKQLSGSDYELEILLEEVYGESFKSDDLEKIWQLANSLHEKSCDREAEIIYKRLSGLELITPTNYIYSALATQRLGDVSKAYEIFEQGIMIYPEDYSLKQYYRKACASNYDHLRYSEFMRRISGLDYNLEMLLVEVYEEIINTDDPIKIWPFVDVFFAKGYSQEVKIIYKRLTKLKLINATNYVYSALATQRLGEVSQAYSIFEEGIKAFPEDNFLLECYIQVCACFYDYSRYSGFIDQLGGSYIHSKISVTDMYKISINSGDLLSFLMHFPGIEKDSDSVQLTSLKQFFLETLAKKSVTFHLARACLFFGRYLGFENDFHLMVYEALKKNFENSNEDSPKILRSFKILDQLTTPMIPRYPVDSVKVMNKFIQQCESMALVPVALSDPIESLLDYWTPWQFIFTLGEFAALHYSHALSAFEKLVFATWPGLNYTSSHIVKQFSTLNQNKNKKIKIGFMVHDAMPMMSGLLEHLNKDDFYTVFLRPGSAGKSQTSRDWIVRADEVIECSETNVLSAIETIAAQKLDIIISGPSIAAVFYPMLARLASLQMILLEPNWTNGSTNTDYYISWRLAEPANPKKFYKTAVSYLEHPPYWIERPSLKIDLDFFKKQKDGIRKKLLNCDSTTRVYLCANTPPKLHTLMDEMFANLLKADPQAVVVILRGEYPPCKVLQARLQEKLKLDIKRMIFLPTLSKEDAHSLLMSVDCCLDSFPLCGMSSSFDAAMLGVPIVTLPFNIPFGKWTASIYNYIGVSGLIAKDQEDYIQIAMKLAKDGEWREQKGKELKEKASLFIESISAFEEFQEFIINAWERKLLGLPPANWINGKWQDSVLEDQPDARRLETFKFSESVETAS